MANPLPTLIIRPEGPRNIRKECNVAQDRELAKYLGVHPAQVSRVLSGKTSPGNRFIAGVIDRCGLEFAFTKVFTVQPDSKAAKK